MRRQACPHRMDRKNRLGIMPPAATMPWSALPVSRMFASISHFQTSSVIPTSSVETNKKKGLPESISPVPRASIHSSTHFSHCSGRPTIEKPMLASPLRGDLRVNLSLLDFRLRSSQERIPELGGLNPDWGFLLLIQLKNVIPFAYATLAWLPLSPPPLPFQFFCPFDLDESGFLNSMRDACVGLRTEPNPSQTELSLGSRRLSKQATFTASTPT